MNIKKWVVLLVILAVILAVTAIFLNINMDPDVPVIKTKGDDSPRMGVVGINIEPSPVDDKLIGIIDGGQQ